MQEKWFDDFVAGDVFTSPPYTITEAEMLAFARQYDPQYLHTSKPAAENGPYGGLIASGWHTCALAFGMFMATKPYGLASLGAPGVDKLEWLRPVRPGDRLQTIVSVIKTKLSRSKPDRGLVHLNWRVENQRREPVLSMTGPVMLLRSPQNTA